MPRAALHSDDSPSFRMGLHMHHRWSADKPTAAHDVLADGSHGEFGRHRVPDMGGFACVVVWCLIADLLQTHQAWLTAPSKCYPTNPLIGVADGHVLVKQGNGYQPAGLLGAAAAPLMHCQACQAAPGGRAGNHRPHWRALRPGRHAAAAAAQAAAGPAQLRALCALCCTVPGALRAALVLMGGCLQVCAISTVHIRMCWAPSRDAFLAMCYLHGHSHLLPRTECIEACSARQGRPGSWTAKRIQ